MDPFIVGGVCAGTFAFIVVLLAFLWKFARKEKKSTLLSSPRLFHQGKYVELANEDEFDYPASVNRNKFLQDDVGAEDYPFRDDYNFRAHAPFLAKDEKRHLHLTNVRENARRNRFDSFRTIRDGKYQMHDAVDRVITKGLVGKTRVTTNEPSAECIGHNNSPVGRRGVQQTRVFQSPPRTGSRKGSLRGGHKAQLSDSRAEMIQREVIKPISETLKEDLRQTDYPTTSGLRSYSESSKRGQGVPSSSSKSSGIAGDVRMSEDRVVSRPLELNERQATGSRSFTVKRKVIPAPYERSKPQSVSLTAVYESNSDQLVGDNFTRKSVKDTVEEVKREAQLKRASAESKTDASSTQISNRFEAASDRITDQSMSHSETPSVSWHSRRLLHSNHETEGNQEKMVRPKLSQSVVKKDKLPPIPPPRPSSRSPVSEFPPVPSFLDVTDSEPPSSDRTVLASKTVIPVANKTSRSMASSQNHVSGVSTIRRQPLQNQSPRKRKFSIDRRASKDNNKDIVDHVQNMLDSLSGSAFSQQTNDPNSMPKASAFKPCSSVHLDQNRVTQAASFGSDLSNFTFSPRQTSTPIQSSVDVQKHFRSDRSMIESAIEKRRLRIAYSNSSTGPSATVIHDVRDAVRGVSPSSPISEIANSGNETVNRRTPIKAQRVSSGTPSLLQKTFPSGYSGSTPKRRRSLSTPAAPVFSLTGHGTREHVQTGAQTAPSSPTSDRAVFEDSDEENKYVGNASYMKFKSETERPAHTNAPSHLSPRGLLLKEIRSRRQSYTD